jgi:hypothetical protein
MSVEQAIRNDALVDLETPAADQAVNYNYDDGNRWRDRIRTYVVPLFAVSAGVVMAGWLYVIARVCWNCIGWAISSSWAFLFAAS